MNTHILENDNLKITVSDSGAELCSVFDKDNSTERMWDANPSVWNRHAPILFPFVGKVNGGKYRIADKEYEMKTQHGFARDMVFECVEASDTHVVHRLTSSDATKASYPYDFNLTVTHSIDKDNPRLLHIKWTVENLSSEEMLYSIGAHPGFTVPGAENEKRSDYFLQFPGHDKLSYILLNKETSLAIADKTYTMELTDGFYPVYDNLFDEDALIFDNQNIDLMRIAKPDKTPYITVDCKGFPYVGVWSKPDGQFICLEPWYGITDMDGFSGTLAEKKGILKLAAGCSNDVEYTVEFHA